MAQVTFDPAVGGDGSTVSDDSSLTTGLANGGFRTRLVPAFGQIVAIAAFVKSKALEALGHRNDAEGFAGAANTARLAAEAAAATAGGAAAFIDSNPVVKGSVDPTKQVRFEVDGLASGVTRVVTVPDKNFTMAGAGDWLGANAYAGKQSAPMFIDGIVVNTAAAGAISLDLAVADVFDLTLSGNVTGTTFTNVPVLAETEELSVVVRVTQPATAYTYAYPTTAAWLTSGGTAPAAPAANKTIEYVFTKRGTAGWVGRKGAAN